MLQLSRNLNQSNLSTDTEQKKAEDWERDELKGEIRDKKKDESSTENRKEDRVGRKYE